MSKDFSDNINTEIPQPDDPAALLKRKKDNIKKKETAAGKDCSLR